MGTKFGDPANPLLVSVPLGRAQSMPGMMETVLNVGLYLEDDPRTDQASRGNERFVYDAYRRLIMMYSDVVMEKAEGIEPAEGKGIRRQLERMLHEMKEKKGVQVRHRPDGRGPEDALRRVQAEGQGGAGQARSPTIPMEQLWGGIGAVFKSWNGKRADLLPPDRGHPGRVGHRRATCRPWCSATWATSSATGVAFTRNPATGENKFYGEWLVNAQGEDVVAGIRTPSPLNEATEERAQPAPAVARKPMPETLQAARRHPRQARAALPRHAGHRVHHPGGQALHAPVPRRQADRHRRP